MKKTLSIIVALAMIVTAFSLCATAKKSTFTNLAKGGDFNSADCATYFRIGGETPYFGGTCTWQEKGGVNNTGCIKMMGSGTGANVACLMVEDKSVTPTAVLHEENRKPYYVSVDIFRPEGNDATIFVDAENGVFAGHMEATKNGQWETLDAIVWSEGVDVVLRVFNEAINVMDTDEYVLIDNIIFAEFDVNADYHGDDFFVPGNLVWDGNMELDLFPQYSLRLDSSSPYNGSTCSIVDSAPLGRTGKCLKMVGTGDPSNVACIMDVNATKSQCNMGSIQHLYGGKEYIAFFDVYRPEGVNATICFDFESRQTTERVVASGEEGTGKWERKSVRFTLDNEGDYAARIYNMNGDLGTDQCVYIDNFYIGEYNSSVNYDVPTSPRTGDSLVPVIALTALIATAGVIVCKKVK